MKFSCLILTVIAITRNTSSGFSDAVSAFSPPPSSRSNNGVFSPRTGSIISGASRTRIPTRTTPLYSFQMGGNGQGTIDVTDEFAERDVQGMENWALQNGVQKADGVQLFTEDGADYQLITNQDIPAGSPVLFVPSGMVLSSNAVAEEYGGELQATENNLVQMEKLTADRLPLFRLMLKILVEYEKGQQSPFFPWLTALPKRFYNGVSMTDDCFSCLPPYAGWLTSNEKKTFIAFVDAMRNGYVPIGERTVNDDNVVKWAYNVALTRFTEVWQPSRQKLIAPMADMFNHATYPNVEVTFDYDGNCVVNAAYNIPAGSPLTISLGDPTNPTPIFAKYGFLYNDCTTIFCKALHLQPQIEELGYDFKDLLFEVENGDIAPKVWDIFLYNMLLDNDQNLAEQFYSACKMNDEQTKQNFHQQYFQYTLEALRNHVDTILYDVDRLTQKAQSLNANTHPRVPVIVAHNDLVRQTFSRTQAKLSSMG